MFRQFRKVVSIVILVAFINTSIKAPAYAQEQLNLPAPGTMVNLSPAYVPVLIKGLKVHPENPLLFDFILDTGRSGLKVSSPEFKDESEKLIKYFLASLTIKEDDLWVNLSPYEKNRIIPDQLGQTELGQDMLAQDYILKQLTASLIYPEKQLGKEFWNRVYAKAQQEFGTSDIPVNTFNKVWIIADKAKILERNNVGYVVGSHLKVMLEEDYLALKNHTAINQVGNGNKTHTVASQVVREIIIPALEKEVNQGQHFAPLRQMFYSMILATWYRVALKNALLNQVYSNKGKTAGVLSDDPMAKEEIFQQYLKAYKKGVFNFIKEDMDAVSKQPVPRKYFSGGLARDLGIAKILDRAQTASPEELASMDTGDLAMETVDMAEKTQISNSDAAMSNFQKVNADNVPTVISQIAALPADNRVVMIVNTPFEVSNETAINFLNSGRQNIITLKGPQGVFDEFYFDGHPKSVGVSRAVLQSVGIDVPEDGILDPFTWPDRTELKQKIFALKDKIGLPLAAVERLEAEKFRTLKTLNAQKIKISETPIIFDQGDTAYANLHILDLRVRDKNGQERIVRTYQNSPVITNEVKILGVGPETIKVWGRIIKDAKAVILVGNADEFSEALNSLPDGQIRLQISGNNTEAIAQLERQDIWRPSEYSHHLSSEELSLLREADEQDGFHSKWARNDQRITHQAIQIETALGSSRTDAESKAEQIITDLNSGKVKFKGEEVHILNGTGTEAKVIGRIDRGIAEKYGYVHETANVVLTTPDGKVLLQLRNKTNYDDHLAMYGGHLGVGESHFSGVLEETKQETGLPILQTLPVFVGYESYDMPGDSNRERRSWFVKKLTPDEYEMMKANEASEESKLGIAKNDLTRSEYKQALFRAQNERKDGTGEVVGTYAFTFGELTQALTASDRDSPFADKTTRFLPVAEQFKDGEATINAFYTPDSLNQLLSGTNTNLWQSIQKTAADLAMTAGQIETLISEAQRLVRQFEPPTYFETRAGNVYSNLVGMFDKLTEAVKLAQTKSDWNEIKETLAADKPRTEREITELSQRNLSSTTTYRYNQREELKGLLLKAVEDIILEVSLNADSAMKTEELPTGSILINKDGQIVSSNGKSLKKVFDELKFTMPARSPFDSFQYWIDYLMPDFAFHNFFKKEGLQGLDWRIERKWGRFIRNKQPGESNLQALVNYIAGNFQRFFTKEFTFEYSLQYPIKFGFPDKENIALLREVLIQSGFPEHIQHREEIKQIKVSMGVIDYYGQPGDIVQILPGQKSKQEIVRYRIRKDGRELETDANRLLYVRDKAMTTEQIETLKGAETEISKILEGQFQRGDITEVVYKNALKNTYQNLYEWTTDDDIYRIDPSIRQINLEAIRQGRWDDVIEAYRQEVAFGTAGIRGKAVLTFDDLQKFVQEGPLGNFLKGPNTINAFKLLKTTAGVIRFAKETGRKRIVIGYDSRIGGEQFAQMIARLFIAQSTPDYQFKIFLFDEASPFPELSFGITTDDVKGDIGILLSASHNPADYNGYKITLANGSQLNQKAKDAVVAAIAKVQNSEIILVDSLADAKSGQITWLGADEPLAGKDYYGFNRIDMHSLHVGQTQRFILNKQAVAEYGKEVRIGYAAFNGAGFKAVPRLLREAGFTNLQVISKLQRLDGTFPAWKFGEQPDPGDPISADIAVREFIEEHGQKAFDDLDILIGTDPDADRMGLIVKVPEAQQKYFGKYRLLSANDAWTLLLWYRLTMKKQMGLLNNPANHTVVFSHVTTDALEAVAREFGIEPSGKMLDMTNTEDRGDYLSGRRTWVGFTYLAEALEDMEQAGKYVEMLAEESNGVSIQGHTKEKDGTLAAVLLAEIAAYAKSQNTTIFELLDKVYSQIGHYATANKALPRVGSFEKAAGISEKIKIIQKSEEWGHLANQRAGTANPFMIAGKKVIGAVQFASGRIDKSHYEGVPDEGVRFFFEDETMKPGDNFTNSRNYITIRASGTSQALRFYTQIFSKESTPEQKAFNYHEAERIALEAQKQILEDVGLDKHLSLVTQQLKSFYASGSDEAALANPGDKDEAMTAKDYMNGFQQAKEFSTFFALEKRLWKMIAENNTPGLLDIVTEILKFAVEEKAKGEQNSHWYYGLAHNINTRIIGIEIRNSEIWIQSWTKNAGSYGWIKWTDEVANEIASDAIEKSSEYHRKNTLNRFKNGGDVVGLHDLPAEHTRTGIDVTIQTGLIPELKGPQETAIAREHNSVALLAQTVKSGLLTTAVQAGGDVLIASEMLSQNEIADAHKSADVLGKKVVIIAGIDTTQPNVEDQISMAVANGADGVKFKPAGKGQELNTQRYIEYTQRQYPNLVIMLAGGVNAVNRNGFGQTSKAGMGAGTIDEIKTIAQWAKTVQDSAQTVIPPGGIDLNSKNMSMDVSGHGIDMNFDPAMIAQFQRGDFSGIVANIIRIIPIKSALPIMGLETSPN